MWKALSIVFVLLNASVEARTKTKLPAKSVRCYGVVPTGDAHNMMRLGRKHHECDPDGYVFLLQDDCAGLFRGYDEKGVAQFACVGVQCEVEKIPSDRCQVSSAALKEALEKYRQAMLVEDKEEDPMVARTQPFKRYERDRAPFLPDY